MKLNTIIEVSSQEFGDDGILKTPIDGVFLLSRKWFGDTRGAFQEIYRTRIISEYLKREVPPIKQSQLSWSDKNVIRGMHAGPEYKFITPLIGEFTIALVDVRKRSDTFGKWLGLHINANKLGERSYGYFIVPGIANGFEVKSLPKGIEKALYTYQVTQEYSASTSLGFNVFDKTISFPWSVRNPEVSDNDKKQQTFEEFVKTVDQDMYK